MQSNRANSYILTSIPTSLNCPGVIQTWRAQLLEQKHRPADCAQFHFFFLPFIVNQQVKRIDKTNRKYGKCSYFIGRESSGAEGSTVPPQLLVCSHTHQFCMQEPYTQSLHVIVSIQTQLKTFGLAFILVFFRESTPFVLWCNCLITIFFWENISRYFLYGAQIENNAMSRYISKIIGELWYVFDR